MRLIVLLLIAAANGLPCSCLGEASGCLAVGTHQAIFTGVVSDIQEPQPPEFFNRPIDSFHFRRVTFRITEAFTGLDLSVREIHIRTGMGGGDCGYPFERGAQYVVYAYKLPKGDQLATGICSPTKPASRAAEDIAYLRQLPAAKPVSQIRVTAIAPQQNATPTGLAGVRVTLQGEDVQRTGTTDSQGKATFADLPPGEYKLDGKLEGRMGDDSPRIVKVHAKGCLEVSLILPVERIVSGRVLNPIGEPAAGAVVEALRISIERDGSETVALADESTADSEGRYRLRDLTTGDYYVGVSLRAWFKRRFEDPSAVTLIHVFESGGKQSLDVVLPAYGLVPPPPPSRSQPAAVR